MSFAGEVLPKRTAGLNAEVLLSVAPKVAPKVVLNPFPPPTVVELQS